MSAATLLRSGRALLTDRGWTKGAFGRRADGERCGAESVYAACFCMAGALIRASGPFGDLTAYNKACALLKEACGGTPIISFNDAQSRVEPVLAAYDRAIAKAEGRAP